MDTYFESISIEKTLRTWEEEFTMGDKVAEAFFNSDNTKSYKINSYG